MRFDVPFKDLVVVFVWLSVVAAIWPNPALGQVSVNVPGVSVNVGGGGQAGVSVSVGDGSSVATTASGYVGEDVEMEGVAIVNGTVSIDGEKLPRGKTRHVGRKSGIKYLIKWGKDGSVAVSQE